MCQLEPDGTDCCLERSSVWLESLQASKPINSNEVLCANVTCRILMQTPRIPKLSSFCFTVRRLVQYVVNTYFVVLQFQGTAVDSTNKTKQGMGCIHVQVVATNRNHWNIIEYGTGTRSTVLYERIYVRTQAQRGRRTLDKFQNRRKVGADAILAFSSGFTKCVTNRIHRLLHMLTLINNQT